MMAGGTKVIPFVRGMFVTKRQREIVDLAFEYWLARFGVEEGSPEDDFYRAQREVTARRSKSRSSMTGLIVMRGSG